MTLPASLVPADPACSTKTGTPFNNYCPALLSEEEVIRGFGAYNSANNGVCEGGGGNWNVYRSTGFSCCKTCRWNKDTAVAAHLQPTELQDCPPCVKAYYETLYRTQLNTAVPVVPLAPYNRPDRCPYGIPQPSNNGSASLPVWLYNPDNDQCYYKSSFARGISNNAADAATRCSAVDSELVTVYTKAEDDFIRLNLLWTGFFGETYTGLRKLGRSKAGFDNTWRWPNGAVLQSTDYSDFDSSIRSGSDSELDDLCMEYLPQQPKVWNPFSCAVNKHYICKRAAVPLLVVPPAATAASCAGAPAAPAGAVGRVMLINAGGPAICGYSADTAITPVGTGGTAESWYGTAAAGNTCSSCESNPTLGCVACSVRFGGAFSYTLSSMTPGKRYTLRFTFSEVYWTEAGRRSMNVEVGGVQVLSGIDVFALAGARFTPVVRDVNVTALAGSLTVTVRATTDNAILAALEVYDMGSSVALDVTTPPPSTTPTPTPTPPAVPIPSSLPSVAPSSPPETQPSPAPSSGPNLCPNQPANSTLVARVNCGGPALDYPAGCPWSSDTAASPYPGSTGGIGRFQTPTCTAASNPYGPVACVDKWGGAISYTFPATSGVNYRVVVHMAECYWTGQGTGSTPGRRLVRIYTNGQLRTVDPVDPFTAAALPGATNRPALFTYDVQGTNAGNVVVSFDATEDQPSVVGIEVYGLALASPRPTAPY